MNHFHKICCFHKTEYKSDVHSIPQSHISVFVLPIYLLSQMIRIQNYKFKFRPDKSVFCVCLNCKCWRFVWKDLISSLVTLRELSRCILTWSTNARGWLWSHCGSAWLYCFNSPVVQYCYTTL